MQGGLLDKVYEFTIFNNYLQFIVKINIFQINQ